MIPCATSWLIGRLIISFTFNDSLCLPMAGCSGLSSTTTLGGDTRGGELASSPPPAWRPAISSAPELNVSSEGDVAGVSGEVGVSGEAGEAARLRSRRCWGLNHSG